MAEPACLRKAGIDPYQIDDSEVRGKGEEQRKGKKNRKQKSLSTSPRTMRNHTRDPLDRELSQPEEVC